MNMKSGFVLTELLISIIISSIVMIAFVTSFNQIQKSSASLEHVISVDSKAIALQMILENDISGAFIPNINSINFDNTGDKSKDKNGQELDKVFFERRYDNDLIELSFVTNNSLFASVDFKPRISRIFYFVKDEVYQPGVKTFYRQQDEKYLDYDLAKTNSRKYEVITGIKSFKTEYAFEVDKEKEESVEGQEAKTKEKPGPEKQKSIKKEYKIIKELEKDTTEHKLPSYVIFTVELWKDFNAKEAITFIFKFQIYGATYNLPFPTFENINQTKDNIPKPPQLAASVTNPEIETHVILAEKALHA